MNKKILIFDDDESIVDVLTLILEEADYKVYPATEGREALQITKIKNPDLILLDILMSGMDGKEFTKKIQEYKHSKKIPIIIISANSRTEDISNEIGAVDFILKPFEIKDVLDKVKKHI